MASIAALADRFDAQDTTKWDYPTAGASVAVSGGTLQITPTAGYPFLGSLSTNDVYLTDTSCPVELVQATNVGLGSAETFFGLQSSYRNNYNQLTFSVIGGNLLARTRVAASDTTLATVTYSATTHRWLRFRSVGTTVYWETSPDGVTWTQLATWVATFDLGYLFPIMGAGYWDAETSPGLAIFDNFAIERAAVDLTYVGSSAWVAPATSTSISPTYPTGLLERDVVELIVHSKPDTAIPDTPTSWNIVGSLTGGGTAAQGAGTGPTRMTVFSRVVPSGGLTGSQAVTITGGSSPVAHMRAYRASGTSLTYDHVMSSWSVGTAALAIGGTTAAMPLAAKDELTVVLGTTDDQSTTLTLTSVTATGSTFGTLTRDPNATVINAQGNDISATAYRVPVTAGSSTGAVTVAATSSSSETAMGIVLRVRASAEVASSTTYTKAGGAAPAAAGSGAKVVTAAAVVVKLGAAAAPGAGSGPKVVTSATIRTKAGGAVPAATGSGPKSVTPATTRTKAGGAAPAAAGSGAKVRTSATIRVQTGAAASTSAGSGVKVRTSATIHAKAGAAGAGGATTAAKAITRVKAGSAASPAAGSGARVVTTPVARIKSGGAAAAVTGEGPKDGIPIYPSAALYPSPDLYPQAGPTGVSTSGAAAAVAGGSGAKVVTAAAVHAKAGGGVTSWAGAGVKVRATAATHSKAGSGTTAAAGSGARQFVRVKAGAAGSAGVGTASRTVTSAAVVAKSGGGATASTGIGSSVVAVPGGVVKTGGGAAHGTGSGARAMTSPTGIAKAGGAAGRGAGSGSRIITVAVIHTKTGGSATRGAGTGAHTVTVPRVLAKAGGAVATMLGAGRGSAGIPSGGATVLLWDGAGWGAAALAVWDGAVWAPARADIPAPAELP